MKQEFKVGDRVTDIQYGDGSVTEIRLDTTYPIKVRLDDIELGKSSYTLEGKYWSADAEPQLKHKKEEKMKQYRFEIDNEAEFELALSAAKRVGANGWAAGDHLDDFRPDSFEGRLLMVNTDHKLQCGPEGNFEMERYTPLTISKTVANSYVILGVDSYGTYTFEHTPKSNPHDHEQAMALSEELAKCILTKPDHTGCNPVVVAALRQGNYIKCEVWDSTGAKRQDATVKKYDEDKIYPYYCELENGEVEEFRYAIPIKKKKKKRQIVSAKKVVDYLVDNEYECDEKGDWISSERQEVWHSTDFHYCGRSFSWNLQAQFPELIEEVEV